MPDMIKCPSCGESNLPDQEFCQYCQARLQPLTGTLMGEDAPIKSGELPTKKNTAELEPILPQWLRDARESARQEDPTAAQLDLQQPPQLKPASVTHDLLAGLQSQAGDEEEDNIPDWLASITGHTSKSTKSQSQSSDLRRVELGGRDDFAKDAAAELSSDKDDSSPAGLKSPEPQPDENNEVRDWFRNLGNSEQAQQSEQPESIDNSFSNSLASDGPDWLTQTVVNENAQSEGAAPAHDSTDVFADAPEPASDAPDWLRVMGIQNEKTTGTDSAGDSESDFVEPPAAAISETAENSSNSAETQQDAPFEWLKRAEPATSEDEFPDWLSRDVSVSSSLTAAEDEPAGLKDAPSGDIPDWLAAPALESPSSLTAAEDESAELREASSGDIPDWLAAPALDSLSSLTAAEDEPAELKDAPSGDIPDWLEPPALESPSSFTAVEDESVALEDAPFSGITDRLEAVGLQSPIHAESEAKPIEPVQDADTLGWLDTFKAVSAYQPETPIAQADFTPPDFTEDFQASDNMDELFTELPDGLLSESEVPPPMPTEDIDSEAIAPDDLPAWVEAMRPLDSGISQLSSTASLSGTDQIIEESGALAGLQGVLPAGLGFAPMSKPKVYPIRLAGRDEQQAHAGVLKQMQTVESAPVPTDSYKLQASEEQQAHAALLEQIISAEAAPVPMASFSVLRTSRSLRWFLALIIFGIITLPLTMRTQMFSLPVGIPLDVNGALQVAQSIPESAPVLVAFDYEPARAGEMEAAAAPMFDQMILLRHPHLTFISTNETGAILVERFLAGPLAAHNYQSGIQYVNLGYLPGGQMGIRAFGQKPQVTAPFDLSLSSAWQSAPLAGVSSLSQFAALIVVTDDADAARTWIEQTQSARGGIPFVVISSAQAAPMIQPYYESQQISGLVPGLYGGALFEQYNAGRPGTARLYWDAFSLGMLLAMSVVFGGGLWSLTLGLRDRRAAGEAA